MDIKNTNNGTIPILSHCACWDNNILWFIHAKYSSLIKYNLETNELQYVCTVSNINSDNDTNEYAVKSMFVLGEYIVLVPNTLDCVTLINKETYEMSRSKVDKEYNVVPQNGYFRMGFAHDGKNIFIPSQFKSIVSFDFEKMTCITEYDWKNKLYGEDEIVIDFSVEQDKIAMLLRPSNDVLIYYLDKKVAERISFGRIMSTIVIIGDVMYAKCDEDTIIELNITNKQIIAEYQIDFIKDDVYFYNYGEYIIVDFILKNKLLLINKKFEIKNTIIDEENYSDEVYLEYVVGPSMIHKGEIMYINNATGEIIKFSVNGIIMRKKIYLDSIGDKIFLNYYQNNKIVHENKYFRLDDWLGNALLEGNV